MENVLLQSNSRDDLKELVGLAKKIGVSVRYVDNFSDFPKETTAKKRAKHKKDLDIINKNVDFLNSEAEDVLSYQVF